jgi:hypothetical protein
LCIGPTPRGSLDVAVGCGAMDALGVDGALVC